jgi:hypothetical protein
MAIVMVTVVAYVSVNGLMRVFAGAGIVGLIFFSAIEVAKVIATSAIHTYGKKIGWFYNILLGLGITIAMIITSMGIYGFLSSTYRETANKMNNIENQIILLESNLNNFQEQFDLYNNERSELNNSISSLRSGLSNNVVQYTNNSGQLITTTSSANRKALEKQLERALSRQSDLNLKIDEVNSKIFDLKTNILDVRNSDKSSTELGPLKYLSDVTGSTMDDVMKWFILMLIIIGDPMAILLVIVFSKVMNSEETIEVKDIAEEVDYKEIQKKVATKVEELRKEGKLPEINKDDDKHEPSALANSQYRLEEEIIEEEKPIKKVKRKRLNNLFNKIRVSGKRPKKNEITHEVVNITPPQPIENEIKSVEPVIKPITVNKNSIQRIDTKLDNNNNNPNRGFSVKIPNRRR